jgi:DNA topoisomerase II
MAQNFVGSNNLNLLIPSGQFGTRLLGGTDSASARYIFTCLDPIARILFPEDDDGLLNYLEDDGQSIEPNFFCPIIPLILVNGSHGIGTGWSTFIPPHNPIDVVRYIQAKLDGDAPLPSLKPFARGFKGKIEEKSDHSGYTTFGIASKVNDTSVRIDELPLQCWTNSYKDQLIRMQERADIVSFLENHTTTSVSFTVELKPLKLQQFLRTGLETSFKLRKPLPTTNMHGFDHNYKIRKFESAEEIADAYFPVRLQLYSDRKSVLQSEMAYSAAHHRNKAKFIQFVGNGKVDLLSRNKAKSKDETVATLRTLEFDSESTLEAIRNNNDVWKRQQLATEVPQQASIGNDDFDYLLSMPLASLTRERIVALEAEVAKREEDLIQIQAATLEDMWRQDLEKLEKYLS